MLRLECSEQVSPDCEETMLGTAADPDRPPLCRACFELLSDAMVNAP